MSTARRTLSRETLALISRVETRGELSACLGAIAAEVGADHYLLLGTVLEHGGERVHVIASSWVYDTIQIVGPEGLAALASDRAAAPVGEAVSHLSMTATGLGDVLASRGHVEICCVRLHAASQRCQALFSARKEGGLDVELLSQAQLACCYLLSRVSPELLGAPPPDSLSERERECLRWVSEGKTTGEIAMIVGVSANTVNSYLANAIQKYGASNRAMAIATAIRSGAI